MDGDFMNLIEKFQQVENRLFDLSVAEEMFLYAETQQVLENNL